VIDLCELVVGGERQVELRRQADVVGSDACELLGDCDSRDGFYLGDGNLLFFGRWLRFGLVVDDADDEALLVGLQLVELLLAVDELEGLRPVVLVPVPHGDKLNNKSNPLIALPPHHRLMAHPHAPSPTSLFVIQQSMGFG
jgi:hypothetical protein